ncbi:MAG: DUF2309 domain-containing protein [Chloroflexaceae bacterium]|nr:DUF2309 domain-containing protein [Chloroflexaceae bacterium]
MFDETRVAEPQTAPSPVATYTPATLTAPPTLHEVVVAVCNRIPPLWDLSNYVAVNPFLGFAAQPLPEAARIITDGIDARVLPDVDFYRARWQTGAFGQAELAAVAARYNHNPATLAAILDGTAPMPMRPAGGVLTCAEQHDQQYGTYLHQAVLRQVTLWCAVHVPTDGGIPWKAGLQQRLFTAWHEAARADRSLDIAGLRGWHTWIQQLPTDPYAAIEAMLKLADIAPAHQTTYLYRLLGGVFGWASFLRRDPWAAQSEDPGAVADLLAMRICTDVAVKHLAKQPAGKTPRTVMKSTVEDETIRALFQEALEDGYATRMLHNILPPPTTPQTRPAVQAFFCIDVRSEVFRRHLEALSPQIVTMGFAGFFGVTLDWQTDGKHSARCPVLLQPAVQIASQAPDNNTRSKLITEVQKAPGAAFTFVEALGIAYGIGLAGDALRWFQAWRADEGHAPFTLDPDTNGRGIPLTSRIEAGAAILKNMGLRKTFGRLVLLCGHGSTSENNSHAAGLDCGACGGHSGAINARIAAAILNDPAVRDGLVEHGWNVPADTWFMPGQHDTTLDTVALFDTAALPASHQADLRQLQSWLDQAGAAGRAERARSLGLADKPRNLLETLIRRRARDWSEVRPEWALARNAAFIAARRDRTRGVNLEGRSFLHEYDWTTDPDNSILTLILCAPMVVASWINLQYFASTVDNNAFGCGTKALHNRIGSLGVVLGNGGDLRTGLALQSVQDADGRWYHEPLRLHVVVEAPHDRIEAVMAASSDVRNLIEHGWVRLFALDSDSNDVAQWVPGRGWNAL